jgi:3,4-dihydroxy 2-butanone 4-phosphate synthase/GTP cyclohydrolase II
VRTSPAEQAVAAIAAGRMAVVVDDEHRENEGDLVMAAEHATPEAMAFFVRNTSGFICVALTAQRADELDLPLMVSRNTERQRTAFTVTVDARAGTTTGISAADRSATARTLADPSTRPQDLLRPGHMHVLRAQPGGVLERPGHTEAAVDLARLAGLAPAGVLCEIVTEDGLGMARGRELEAFAARHGLPLVSIADIAHYRWRAEKLVRRVSEARLPTQFGEFKCAVYESSLDHQAHLALVLGKPAGRRDVLVRAHSECLTGDVFGSRRCDCGQQLRAALRLIADEGTGAVVYLRGHEGRGIGISHKIRAYGLQDEGHDTVEANLALGLPVDARHYGVGAQIIADLGAKSVRLLTNNPAKLAALSSLGVHVSARAPLFVPPNSENVRYLRAKRDHLGHLLGEGTSI